MRAATGQPPRQWRAARRAALCLFMASCARFGYELLPGLEPTPNTPLASGGAGSALSSGGTAGAGSGAAGAAAAGGALVAAGGTANGGAASGGAAGGAGADTPVDACQDGLLGAGEQGVDCGGP